MSYTVGGGGISPDFEVDITALKAAIAKTDKYMGDLVAVNREAANAVKDERKASTPYRTGHLANAAYVRASTRNAYVGLKNTGWRSNDYIGVGEFGGNIPRHQGKSKYKTFTHHKDRKADGYYLVPALDRKRDAITDRYRQHAAEVVRKYMS